MSIDPDTLDERLSVAVTQGIVSKGVAHRAVLATRLLDTLSESGGGGRPPRTLGLSRAAVHKHVGHLRALGFAVDSVPGVGYRLERSFADLVAAEAVLPFLLGVTRPPTAAMVGLPYLYLPRCGSTNAGLREAMASRGDAGERPGVGPASDPAATGRQWTDRQWIGPLAAGALLVTDDQTGGRGRLGRVWWSEGARDLTFSVLLRPSLAPAQAHLLSLAAALAVAEVLEALPGLVGPVAVKWPNDVLLGDDKVSGILLEGSIDADSLHWAVAGIGLNVNSTPSAWVTGARPEDAEAWARRPRPVSLREHLGREVPRAPLLAALLARLSNRWADLEDRGSPGPGNSSSSGPLDPGGAARATSLLAALRQRDALVGLQVEVVAGLRQKEVVVSGEAVGIGSEGQLLVRAASGETVAVFSGDVTLRAVNPGPIPG
jgi:BirA family biotin operon repressor/biotin-[acetyl-CoA-carboxylase] ligase